MNRCFFLSIFFLVTVSAQKTVTAFYQPTPFPTKNYKGESTPQDIDWVHVHQCTVANVVDRDQCMRDGGKLQVGGRNGDLYLLYLKFDLAGLPVSPDDVIVWLKSYDVGGETLSTRVVLCRVNVPWSTASSWSDMAFADSCSGWFNPPTPGYWWGFRHPTWYREWRSGVTANNGVLLYPESQDNNFLSFRSSSYGDYTLEDWPKSERPGLQFTFTLPPGMPDFKLPLPGDAKWLVTNEVGGHECMSEPPASDKYHQADNYFSLDIAGAEGTPILAPASGKVSDVGGGEDDPRGFYITLDLGAGYEVRLLHFQDHAARKNGAHLKVGDKVETGDQVGKMGKTGEATGVHLHINFWHHGAGAEDSQLSYALMEGSLLKSFQTECLVDGNGKPVKRIRSYWSTNTQTGK